MPDPVIMRLKFLCERIRDEVLAEVKARYSWVDCPRVPIIINTHSNTRRLGSAHARRDPKSPSGFRPVAIKISLRHYALIHPTDKHLEETVRHELAHVWCFFKHGHCKHGPCWRRSAIMFGASPRACAKTPVDRTNTIVKKGKIGSWGKALPPPVKSAARTEKKSTGTDCGGGYLCRQHPKCDKHRVKQ
jgi:hypothetical protein